ncbi:condensation domain-containing protein [Streptomyces sp. BR1]|uniref:condensation domain-containing protein n=1 Tax=Streptomyces sp. BR1 TaxID=1592323 RepID=UPI00402B805C
MTVPQQGIPLSVGQEAMWIAWELEPEQLSHIIPLPFVVRGELDVARLRQAVAAVGEAYPQLRAHVARTDDGPVLHWGQAPDIPVIERSVTAEVTEAVREAWQEPFDLRSGPLARVYVLRGPEYPTLLFVVHHLVFDGASVLIMLDAFRRAYAGEELRPADHREALTAFAHRSRELMDTATGDAHRAYWKRALGSGAPGRVLPPNRDAESRYTMFSADVPADLASQLRERAGELGCSYFTVLLGAYFAVLRRHSGADDLLVSIPFHGRTDPSLHDKMGYFVNPLPIRHRLHATDRYTDVVLGLRSAVKESLGHGELPLPAIMREAGFTGPQARAYTHQSLFQYWHAGQRDDVDVQRFELRSGDTSCVLSLMAMESTAGYTLAVMVREDSGGTHVLWKDPTGSVGLTAVAELAEDYLAILKTVAAGPEAALAPVLGDITGRPTPEPPTDLTIESAGTVSGMAAELAEMTAVWEEVLGIDGITPDDSFFELGGHSLLAEALTIRAGRQFGMEVPIRTLFTYPRLRDFTEQVLAAVVPVPVEETRADPATGLDGNELPASSFQQRIWLIEQSDMTARGNVCLAWRTPGGLEPEALGQALAALVEGHEILRTRFVERDGVLVQQVGEPWRPEIEQLDLRDVERCDDGITAWLTDAAERRFELGSGRLLRVAVADLGAAGQTLLMCVHHQVVDGESIPILLAELERCYAAVREGRSVEPPAVQYREFVAAQQAEQANGAWAADLRYWAEALSGAPAYLDVETSATPQEEGTVAIATVPGLLGRLQPVQAERGVSWFMVAAAALAVVLHRWSGRDDITFEAPIANRGLSQGRLAGVLGPCMNTVILRSTLRPGAVLADVLRQLRSASLDGFEHSRAPFAEVMDHLGAERRDGRSPFADIILNMNTRTSRRARLGGAELTPVVAESLAEHDKQFGLTVTLTEHEGELTGTLAHRGALLTVAEARQLADDLAKVLVDFADDINSPVR